MVTGAGGAPRPQPRALGLAGRGALKVVVNDLGQGGEAPESSLAVVDEIEEAGGVAMADGADVSNPEQVAAEMVARAEAEWGGVDILVNNAGILRDKTFAKMDLADFEVVLKVHLLGSAICTKAVWAGMRERNYGRILFTASASGIYGNFGQANYGAAKAGMIGLMNVLHLEGAKNNIRVNTLAPTAATNMTAGLLPQPMLDLMTPESVTPAVLCARQRKRALARHPRRGGRGFRGHPYRRKRRPLFVRSSSHAGDDRRALRRDRQSCERPPARQRLRPDFQIRRGGGPRDRRRIAQTRRINNARS